jgi:hypothetical protein
MANKRDSEASNRSTVCNLLSWEGSKKGSKKRLAFLEILNRDKCLKRLFSMIIFHYTN